MLSKFHETRNFDKLIHTVFHSVIYNSVVEVLWIRIQIGKIFSNFMVSYSEYGSTQVKIGQLKAKGARFRTKLTIPRRN